MIVFAMSDMLAAIVCWRALSSARSNTGERAVCGSLCIRRCGSQPSVCRSSSCGSQPSVLVALSQACLWLSAKRSPSSLALNADFCAVSTRIPQTLFRPQGFLRCYGVGLDEHVMSIETTMDDVPNVLRTVHT